MSSLPQRLVLPHGCCPYLFIEDESSEFGSTFSCDLAQLFDVAQRRFTEEPFVLARELDSVAVAHVVTGTGSIKTFR
jgi:hypothetical protein